MPSVKIMFLACAPSSEISRSGSPSKSSSRSDSISSSIPSMISGCTLFSLEIRFSDSSQVRISLVSSISSSRLLAMAPATSNNASLSGPKPNSLRRGPSSLAVSSPTICPSSIAAASINLRASLSFGSFSRDERCFPEWRRSSAAAWSLAIGSSVVLSAVMLALRFSRAEMRLVPIIVALHSLAPASRCSIELLTAFANRQGSSPSRPIDLASLIPDTAFAKPLIPAFLVSAAFSAAVSSDDRAFCAISTASWSEVYPDILAR
ncbi:MAG: hypothetical protein A4E49_03279 [Methanosaeta sp. PtaU1.Bin112]|nr:MAG: hypothetical protein A4E49_03279 [Methanosaeta sp. PtaU1.Bin112]